MTDFSVGRASRQRPATSTSSTTTPKSEIEKRMEANQPSSGAAEAMPWVARKAAVSSAPSKAQPGGPQAFVKEAENALKQLQQAARTPIARPISPPDLYSLFHQKQSTFLNAYEAIRNAEAALSQMPADAPGRLELTTRLNQIRSETFNAHREFLYRFSNAAYEQGAAAAPGANAPINGDPDAQLVSRLFFEFGDKLRAQADQVHRDSLRFATNVESQSLLKEKILNDQLFSRRQAVNENIFKEAETLLDALSIELESLRRNAPTTPTGGRRPELVVSDFGRAMRARELQSDRIDKIAQEALRQINRLESDTPQRRLAMERLIKQLAFAQGHEAQSLYALSNAAFREAKNLSSTNSNAASELFGYAEKLREMANKMHAQFTNWENEMKKGAPRGATPPTAGISSELERLRAENNDLSRSR